MAWSMVSQSSLHKGRRGGELLLKPPRSGLPVVELLASELISGAHRRLAVGHRAWEHAVDEFLGVVYLAGCGGVGEDIGAHHRLG